MSVVIKPKAVINAPTSVQVNTVVTLDGTQSTGATKYHWIQKKGKKVKINDEFKATATFTPTQAGPILIKLKVDSQDEIDRAFITILVTTGPAPDQPLVVNAGADVTVTEGKPVILRGSAVDPDNSIIRADWTQLDPSHAVAIVDLVPDPNDPTDVSFIAPMIETDREILSFQLEAENDKHEIKLDTVVVTILSDTAPPPPPPVTGLPDLTNGVVLFDSNVIWNNGHARTMTGHHEFDPDDPKTEVAAGGHGTPRKWDVDGHGKSKLSGGMSRVYNHSKHKDRIVLLQTFIFDPSLDNFSLEIFSRHNEGGAIANRTGGLQNHLARNVVGGKYESYHKSYHDLGEKSYPGGKKINSGDEIRFALLAEKNGINYEEWMFIDWDHNSTYTQVYNAKYIEKENPAGAVPEPLYWRWRVNGNAPTEIPTWDVKFIQLPPS